jgi:hypothetical protein
MLNPENIPVRVSSGGACDVTQQQHTLTCTDVPRKKSLNDGRKLVETTPVVVANFHLEYAPIHVKTSTRLGSTYTSDLTHVSGTKLFRNLSLYAFPPSTPGRKTIVAPATYIHHIANSVSECHTLVKIMHEAANACFLDECTPLGPVFWPKRMNFTVEL